MASKFTLIKDDLLAPLDRLLATYRQEFTAALTVAPKHEYWVVLEYGSGQAEPGARQPMADDPVVLRVSSSLPGPKPLETHTVTLSDGTTITSKWYPITARLKKNLWFIDRQGRTRTAKTVYHPGVQARGFMRRIIFAWQKRLLASLRAKVGTTFPVRSDHVALVNLQFRTLVEEIREATPVGNEPASASPLKDAWGMTPTL